MEKLHCFDEVFDSQAVYRKLLEAAANPCRVLSVKEQSDKMYGENASFLVVAMTLLDNEVTFNTCGNTALADNIELLTLAKKAAEDKADFIFISDISDLESIFEKVKCGTLADPQLSATLIIKNNEKADKKVCMFGAGINKTAQAALSETALKAIALRDAQNYEYPQGVDMFFVSDNGDVFCIPRLVMKEGE